MSIPDVPRNGIALGALAILCAGLLACATGSGADDEPVDAPDDAGDRVDAPDAPDAPDVVDGDDAADPGETAPDGDGAGDVDGAGTPCLGDRDCDDYDPCNGVETCLAGFCTSSPPPCDDHITCTTDNCEATPASYTCEHILVHSACPEFEICRPDVGCIEVPCRTDTDCDNGNDCDGTESCHPEVSLCVGGMPLDCSLPCARSRCVDGACVFIECLPGCWDINGDPADGCEVECDHDPRGVTDVPDDGFEDQNCDGIDGTVADGVFVAQDGSPANPGTREFPLDSINDGIAKALELGRRYVYVSAGNYEEAVALRDGVQVHGGYLRASDWARDGTLAVIRGPRTGAVTADGIAGGALLEYVRIESADALLPGQSSHAVVLNDASGVRVRHAEVVSGSGAAGSAGLSPGANGTPGGNGQTGPGGYEDDSYIYCAGNSPDPPAFQEGGAACTGATNGGGTGGRACKTNDESGCPGNPGGAGNADGAAGGTGGAPVNGGAGGSGGRGTDGSAGRSGAGGSGGRLAGLEWVSDDGEDGESGQNGGGGGGGAGGGSNHSWGTCNDWGGGGGSGGGGGCGGGGGDGGAGGGASIAVLLAGSSLAVEALTVNPGDGGNGGAGRDGGRGGMGGYGRAGGVGYDEGRGGGAGADGGIGGDGGAGGGGTGGDSWCVVHDSTSEYTPDGTTRCRPGMPGLGGNSRGSPGENGTAGERLGI